MELSCCQHRGSLSVPYILQVAVKFFEQLTCEEFNYRSMNFVPATMAVLASVEANVRGPSC